MNFFRKCAALLAILFALMLAVSAPYLVPVNPDSAVFRSAVLPLILIFATFFPVRHALQTHSRRTLGFGLALGLIFAVCLSLGSELVVYDGLLPGKGALLRRLAVPCLAAPTISALFSFAFSFSASKPEKHGRIPGWAFFLLLAACYLLVFLAFYPGVVAYDFEHEIRQFTTGEFEAAHPVFHTLFLGALYTLGEKLFGSMTAGAATYSVVQLLLLAGLYAWACAFVQRRTPKWAAPLLALGFGFLPFHGVMAVSTAKDPLFSGLCVMLCLTVWEIAESPDAALHNRKLCARFAVVCVLMCLLRHNAIAAVALGCVAVLVMGKRAAVLLCAAALLPSLALPRALEASVHAGKTPSSEMMAIPCQQLMRTAERAGVSEDEYAEINSWFSNATHRYQPHNADPAKGGNFTFDRYQENPGDFWSLYLKYAKKYPRVYLEAFLENCAGLWNPDDVSHAHALGGEMWDYVYMNTVYNYEGVYPIEVQSRLPRLYKLLFSFTHHSIQERYPFLAELFRPSFYVYVLLFIVLDGRCQRRRRLALATCPLWGLFATLLFSAGVFVRYAYPMMAAVPPLLMLTLFSDSQI